ncbi:metal-dependent hydrolase [Micromonospora sp. NPDC005652]|uniref:metal-dependent hydrolase n=1 Tax=Micromonospora sp. NPDC005652 TaxID=3157046 RepID=UPI0033BFDC13
MGKSHALSGAVAWLAVSAGWQQAAQHDVVAAGPNVATVLLGAACSAGYALLPDIDHPKSTIAGALGPITRVPSRATAWTAARLRQTGCDHCARGPQRGGHRALTHTAVFALALGALLGWLAHHYGRAAGLPVFGVGVWLATYPALSGRTRAEVAELVLGDNWPTGRRARRVAGMVGSLLIAGLFVAGAWGLPADGWWWVGLAAGVGTFTHSLGDSLTRSGSPLWWPARIRGCRWRPVGTPRWLRFTTGGPGEKVVLVLLLLAGAGSGWVLVT